MKSRDRRLVFWDVARYSHVDVDSLDCHPFATGEAKQHLDRRFLYNLLSFRARLIHRSDDGGSTHLWNVGQLKRDYTALHRKRL